MAEELRLEERVRNAAAVDGDERVGAPRAPFVDGACHDLFARAGFTDDQHLGVAARGKLDLPTQRLSGGTVAEKNGLIHRSCAPQRARRWGGTRCRSVWTVTSPQRLHRE
jgi:hypothetical protein